MKDNLDQKTNRLLQELKDYSPETYLHSINVAKICDGIAEKMGLDENRANTLHYSSLLHDIGKIKIPLEILHKPEKLTPEEFEIVKNHVIYTKDILTENDFPQEIIAQAFHHHEKLDGSGYSEHITKDDLSIEDRILAIADIAEALTSRRSYKDEFPVEKACSILKIGAESGKLDPEITNLTISQLSQQLIVTDHNQ